MNRSRSRDNYGNNNRNKNRNDNRRRDDYGRNNNRNQGGGGGGYQNNNMRNQMQQMNRGSYGMNTGGFSQNMGGMYGVGNSGGMQTQMGSSGYGGAQGFQQQQQNRFGMTNQQMINPWAGNMVPGAMGGANNDEASLAMNILNAVLSSGGPQMSGRGMSPPPGKMRRMDSRDGGYDDRRRRARSPQGRSHQNRQQSSQRFGSDRRGRDGQSSYQRNDDHRFRNSFSKSPGVSRSSRQSSEEPSEYDFRKRMTYTERETESKKFSNLPLKALKCRMCEKYSFHDAMAYLAHIDSKGHKKVARSYHEKIAATTKLLKYNAQLTLLKEKKKAKAEDKKVSEKQCQMCEAPMVYGKLKHENILACKVLHKYLGESLCCGEDHKSRSLMEEHRLSLSHLNEEFETERLKNKKEGLEDEGMEEDEGEEVAEDEEEKKKRQERDEARRKRKFGGNETDEEDEEEEEIMEKKDESEHQEDKQEGDTKDPNMAESEEEEKSDLAETNGVEAVEASKEDDSGENEKEEQSLSENPPEDDKVTKTEPADADDGGSEAEDNKNTQNESTAVKQSDSKAGKKENSSMEENQKGQQQRKKSNKSNKKKVDENDRYGGKPFSQLSFKELLQFHVKNILDDPEAMCAYDPAEPTGLNYINMCVWYHCMACLEFHPATVENLKSHSCSKNHYDLFRSKFMKVKGVRDSPTSLQKLKNVGKRDFKADTDTETKEANIKKEDETAEEQEEKDKPTAENEEAGGDDALYDPYEGESGDLTALLQEKEEQECNEDTDFKGEDDEQESEGDNYEDNMLDYEEDVAEDDDKVEGKGHHSEGDQGDMEEQEEAETEDYQEEGDEEGDEEMKEVQDEGNEVEEEDDQEDGDEEEQIEDAPEEMDSVEEEEEEETPAPKKRAARRGRSKRAF